MMSIIFSLFPSAQASHLKSNSDILTMETWVSLWTIGVILTIIPFSLLSPITTYMMRVSSQPRFRTALNMKCHITGGENECPMNRILRAAKCSENPDCLLMKGNCEWCQCPANPKSSTRFGQAPISLDDGSYLLNPTSIPGNKDCTYIYSN